MSSWTVGHASRTWMVSVPLAAFTLTQATWAQESANDKLDACVKQEQATAAATGAVIGAAGGLLKEIFLGGRKSKEDKAKDTVKAVAVGAAAGASLGFAQAYLTANANCFQKHPQLRPASTLQRTNDFKEISESGLFNPDQGTAARVESVSMPTQVSAGQPIPVKGTFVAFSPDGSEVEVTINRRLFVTIEGKEHSFDAFQGETRKVETGRHVDEGTIPKLPDAIPAGAVFRYELEVAPTGKSPSVARAETRVVK